jgi:hypothetical protein
LLLWRREVSLGLRTMHTADRLRDAAVLEARSRDEEREGMVEAANESRREAAAILVRLFADAA